MPVIGDARCPKFIQERQDIALTVMMSKHLRLGVKCLLSCLPTELVENIVALVHHDDITCTFYSDDVKVKELMCHRSSEKDLKNNMHFCHYHVCCTDRRNPFTLIFSGGIHGLHTEWKQRGATDVQHEHVSKIPNPDKNGAQVLDVIKHKAHICEDDDRTTIYLEDPRIPGYTIITVVLVANDDE